MPNRIIREGILTSPKLAKLGWAEEVFYRRLLSVVDDFGRYYADAGMLRAACYPRQLNKVSDSDVGKWLSACAVAALVRVYPAEDGERYLEVVKFDQQVRAKKSKFPDMRSECLADATQTLANAHLDVCVSVGVSEDVDEREQGASPPAPQAGKRPKSDLGSRLPADWSLPADWRAWAVAERPDIDPGREAESFADYWHGVAGAKGRKADWQATWRNWIRNARGQGARGSPRPTQPTQSKTLTAIQTLQAMKHGNLDSPRDSGRPEQAALPVAGTLPGR